MPKRAKASMKNRAPPTRTNACSLKAFQIPLAKIMESIPAATRPELNNQAPSLTPRSLRAFVDQLNHGERDIEMRIHGKATSGAAIPQSPAILKKFLLAGI
jgi:hypothetical protein